MSLRPNSQTQSPWALINMITVSTLKRQSSNRFTHSFFASIRRLVMPEGPSRHRPEKRIKMVPEHDFESLLSNWEQGNIVQPSQVEGLSALPEESTVHPTPSDGLGQVVQILILVS